jgi:hypothetical protein
LQPCFGYRLYPKKRQTLGKMAHFSYYNPAGFLSNGKRDKLLSKHFNMIK